MFTSVKGTFVAASMAVIIVSAMTLGAEPAVGQELARPTSSVRARLFNPFLPVRTSRFVISRFGLPQGLSAAPLASSAALEASDDVVELPASGRPNFRPPTRSPFRPPPRPPF